MTSDLRDPRASSRRFSASISAWSAQPEARLTSHARQRAARRNLSLEAVRYIMTYGREYHRTGATFFVLRRRDIPPEDRRLAWVMRLEGAVALVACDGVVITLYRNPAATRAILRKMKYRLPWKETRLRQRWDAPGEDRQPDDEDESLLA